MSQGFSQTSGTSAATALVAGATALIFEQAAGKGERMTRDGLVQGLAGRSQDGGTPTGRWQPALGFGCIWLNTHREAMV